MLIIIIFISCCPRIRCQTRRKRKCRETGGWLSEMKLGQWEDEAKQRWPRLRTQANLLRVVRSCTKVMAEGGVWAEIPPKPHSLNKLCLCWQHPAQGQAGNRTRPALRGGSRPASGIGRGRRKAVSQLKESGGSSWCSRDRAQLQRPRMRGQGTTQFPEPFGAGRKPRQVFTQGATQTRWSAGTKQRALMMEQTARSGWARAQG